uniref:E3 ubiquitin-protein ligase n=1 Tax=Mola mola TaxID=94237 RepID=A0A3Q3W0A0_MOLML
MGSGQSSSKLHCNRYLNGQGPPPLQEKHPHPGRPYRGLELCTYLPDNEEGRQVLSLLLKAFHEQLLFTVATSKEGEDMVTTAFIPLKDGYPDSDYLKTVRKLLKEKGTE